MRVSLSAHKPGLIHPHWHLSLTVPMRYSHFSLNKCLFVSVCLLCFCNHLHSCCFLVLVLCCSVGCLLCMLCFLHELFTLIYKLCKTRCGVVVIRLRACFVNFKPKRKNENAISSLNILNVSLELVILVYNEIFMPYRKCRRILFRWRKSNGRFFSKL